MAKLIELKATGETITFTQATEDTRGAYLETLVTLPASGDGPPAHRHVYQDELFEAIEGRLGLDCGKEKIVLEPGQSYNVPMNALHRCYAMDGSDIKFKATFTPALHIEYLLTEMFEACNRNQSKDPSAFDACYILHQIKGEYYLGGIPAFFQDIIFLLFAKIGKLFGIVKAKPKTA